MANSITTSQLRGLMHDNYGHISFDLTDVEIQKWLNEPYLSGKSEDYVANLFSDYLLSQGFCEVQE